jgi:serine phosphatase RsbU (regulator of sigma subunit)
MNGQQVSYFIGGSFGLFLCIQYLAYHLILSKNRETKTIKEDLIFIGVVGITIFLCALFGYISAISYRMALQVIFFRLKVVSSIATVVVFVKLLRFFLIFIKDLGFVETDEYKHNTKKYLYLFYGVSIALAGIVLFTNLIVSAERPSYNISGLIFLVYLLAVGIFEVIEFIKILRKEEGKITKINQIRFHTVLWGGVIGLGMGITEIALMLITRGDFTISVGSIFMYGAAILCVALSLNLLFEYLEVLTRMSESNKKLTDLNKKIMDDIRTAQSLQISLLPLDKQRELQHYLDMELSYMPMQSVGGDYYDFYNLGDDEFLIMLGDASGHGVYAAMIWAMLKVEVEELIEEKVFTDIADAFTILNRRITKILENTYSYATLFACIINQREKSISYISAGHTDQLFYSMREGDVVKIRNKNPIVGTFKKAKYVADSISYVEGDIFLLFTDGVSEGIGPDGSQVGLSRLQDIFLNSCKADGNAFVIISNVLSEIEEFTQGTIQQDDRTIMVIKL